MIKVLWKGILIAMFVFALFALSGCGKAIDVEAEFELGYDGVVKVSEGNPLIAKINNMGEGFEGELQIEVATDGQNKMIYAKAFEIAASSEKVIKMNTPIYMIEKAFKVSLVANGNEIYSEMIKPDKYISPEHTVVAVISDTPDRYRFVNNLMLPKTRYDSDFINTFQYSFSSHGPMTSTVSTMPIPEEEMMQQKTHILYFDSFAEFTEKVNYDYMDYIYIGEASNLNITQDTEAYLLDWIKEGNTLFVETGADYKKILSQLPTSLINYDVVGTETLEFGDYFGGDSGSFEAVIGDINETVGGDYMVLYEMNLGVATPMGAGSLITLRMDLGDEPFSNASYTDIVLNDIVASTRGEVKYYEEDYYGYWDMSYRLGRIPSEKAPPYWLMALIFMIYIVIVGPILYVIFKARDKRDQLWIAIPATAGICIVLLWLVGFATRFDKPITNSISNIEYTDGDSYLNVSTNIAFFNNKNEDVVISWGEDENIDINTNSDYYWGENQENKKLVGKMMVGKEHQYTAYDTPLWTPKYMSANKVVELTNKLDEPMVRLASEGEDAAYEVTNITPLAIEYAFLMVGNTIYTIGELDAFETVTVSDGYVGDVWQYVDTKLAPNLYSDYTPEGRKKQADIELLREQAENHYYSRVEGQIGLPTDVTIFGMNRDAIGYEIDINQEDTEDFNRNIVKMSGSITYEPGSEVKLPHGAMQADYAYDEFNGHMYAYNDYNQGMVVDIYNIGEMHYSWNLPEFLDVEEVELKVEPLYWMQNWHEIYGGYGSGMPLESEFALYNAEDDTWDPIELDTQNRTNYFDIDLSTYVLDGAIQLRVMVQGAGNGNGNSKMEDNMMMVMPTISIEGVVK